VAKENGRGLVLIDVDGWRVFFRLGYLCEADHRVFLASCDGGANSAGTDWTGADGITVINGVVPELGGIRLIGVWGERRWG